MATVFSYPTKDDYDDLSTGKLIQEAKISIEVLSNEIPLTDEFEELKDAVEKIASRMNQKDLEGMYTNTFMGNVTCSLNETSYGLRNTFAKGRQLSDLAAFYTAFGVKVAEATESTDHLGVELEFMAFLALKEALAWMRKEKENIEICVDAQRKFLQDHLGTWIDRASDALKTLLGCELYKATGALASKFVNSEAIRLGVDVKKITDFMESETMPQEGCESTS